jgi:thiamine pyrophosphate-dependent acetolactate synthase large subunit-like protein
MYFPTTHYLNQSGRARQLTAQADVILGLELTDFWGAVKQLRDVVHRDERPIAKPTAKLIEISSGQLFMRSNYQDFQRYNAVDLSIGADAEATLPALIEAVRRELGNDRASAIEARGQAMKTAFKAMNGRNRVEATYAWDASPISTARMYMELWNQIKDDDWALVSSTGLQSLWPQRLWPIERHDQYIGGSGGYGVGYTCASSVGAALALKGSGRLPISVVGDGDLLMVPGGLYTAAHHSVPLLSLVHNNGGFHQEVMHLQRMASRRQRGIENAGIGCDFEDPGVDFAMLARGMGVWAEGPISDPKELGPAIKRALDVVRAGEPALLDIVSQPR